MDVRFKKGQNMSDDFCNASDSRGYQTDQSSHTIDTNNGHPKSHGQTNFEPFVERTPTFQTPLNQGGYPEFQSFPFRCNSNSNIVLESQDDPRKSNSKEMSGKIQANLSDPDFKITLKSEYEIKRSFSLMTLKASKKYTHFYDNKPPLAGSIMMTEDERKMLVRKELHEVVNASKVEITPYCDPFANITHTKLQPFDQNERLTNTLVDHIDELFVDGKETYTIKTIENISSDKFSEKKREEIQVPPLLRCCSRLCDTDRFNMQFPYESNGSILNVNIATGYDQERRGGASDSSPNYSIATECFNGTLYCTQCVNYQKARVRANTRFKKRQKKKSQAEETEDQSAASQTSSKRRKV